MLHWYICSAAAMNPSHGLLLDWNGCVFPLYARTDESLWFCSFLERAWNCESLRSVMFYCRWSFGAVPQLSVLRLVNEDSRRWRAEYPSIIFSFLRRYSQISGFQACCTTISRILSAESQQSSCSELLGCDTLTPWLQAVVNEFADNFFFDMQ